MRLVGLTGGIACGKSLVVSFLQGVPVLDCDLIAREVTHKVRQCERLREKFIRSLHTIAIDMDKSVRDRCLDRHPIFAGCMGLEEGPSSV
jgi:hypothetical protein